MAERIAIVIPRGLAVRVYLSLCATILSFLFFYALLYGIGIIVSVFTGFFSRSHILGLLLVGLGLIPLVYGIVKKVGTGGTEAKESDYPELFSMVKDVVKEFNTIMPSITLLPTDEIFVTGIFKKRLGIGIAALRALSKDQLKAILRHEFGHFHGKDTIVGGFFSRIQLSLEASTKFGAAWWRHVPQLEVAVIGVVIAFFSWAYATCFRAFISLHSRQVERRADFIASLLSGKEVFGSALLNYSAFASYFNRTSQPSIVQQLQKGQAYRNIYDAAYTAYLKEDSTKTKQNVFAEEKGGIFASHPPLLDRLVDIGLYREKLSLTTPGREQAITLLPSHITKEETFSEELTGRVHLSLLAKDAAARQGRCRYCGKQFKKLGTFLEHEAHCPKAPASTAHDSTGGK